MRKISLTIPKPCHENWDQMNPEEKGRFCNSCRKTVVDFTNMSDRQLAEFFKKPKDSVCGRFYNDQLERDILVPRKRIPWLKYFFQFTWPAFMLFLKSCTGSEAVRTRIKSSPTEMPASRPQTEYGIVGMILPQTITIDTTIEKRKAKKEEQCPSTMGDVEIRPVDSTPPPADTIVTSQIPLDTVTVIAYPVTGKVSIMGGVSATVCTREAEIKNTDPVVSNTISESPQEKINFYPNPLPAGSILHISYPAEMKGADLIQVLTVSGQIIASIKPNASGHAATSSISMPPHIAAGVYFIRLLSQQQIVKTEKIVVTR